MVSIALLAWAAGFYEGEGHIHDPSKSGGGLAVIIDQADTWTLNKMQARFGGSVVLVKADPRPKGSKKPLFRWRLSGPAARGFIMTIYMFLSPWRKAQARAALASWRNADMTGRDNSGRFVKGYYQGHGFGNGSYTRTPQRLSDLEDV